MKPYFMGLATLAASCFMNAAHANDATLERGKELFVSGAVPACAVCHALQDAGASGAVGPDLDELQPDAARVLKAVRGGLGVMPPYDQAKLSDADARAIAAYVEKATRQ